jgi:hypothetical protein
MQAASGSRIAIASALGLIIAIAASTDLSAHRKDEFLQAARLAVAPGRIELQLDLTPGIAIADDIIADIDDNRDGKLSVNERQAYVGRVLSAIDVEIDGHAVSVASIASSFPDLETFRRGEGTIQLRLDATLPQLSAGAHHLSYRNSYRHDVGAYLANALVPDSDQVAITAQRRDADQRDLTIDYTLRDGVGSPVRPWLLGSIAIATIGAALLLRYYERRLRASARLVVSRRIIAW